MPACRVHSSAAKIVGLSWVVTGSRSSQTTLCTAFQWHFRQYLEVSSLTTIGLVERDYDVSIN